MRVYGVDLFLDFLFCFIIYLSIFILKQHYLIYFSFPIIFEIRSYISLRVQFNIQGHTGKQGEDDGIIFQHTFYLYALKKICFSCGSGGKESTCNAGNLGLIPGLGRSPGEGKGCPLQYSGLESSMDCIFYGVAKIQTQLCDFHFHFYKIVMTVSRPFHFL